MINIFARHTYLGNRYYPNSKELVLQRVSSQIRGKEIADYLGCNLNPKKTNPGDVNIFVKPYSLNEAKDGDWVDVLDGGRIMDMLKSRPKANIIAAAENSFEFIKDNYPNKTVFIPQHHINIEDVYIKRNGLKTAGYIGAPSPQATHINEELIKILTPLGIKYITCHNFKTREDSVNFYKQIDLLIIADFSPDINPHKIPTKIINAASFGAPSMAFPLQGYKEIEEDYIRINSMDEIKDKILDLKENYPLWSEVALAMSKKYHIKEIAEYYRSL